MKRKDIFKELNNQGTLPILSLENVLQRIETVQYTVSSQNTVESTGELFYDYENQAWVVNGKYQRCEHPDSMTCLCYGRVHAGEWYTIPETGDGAYVQA